MWLSLENKDLSNETSCHVLHISEPQKPWGFSFQTEGAWSARLWNTAGHGPLQLQWATHQVAGPILVRRSCWKNHQKFFSSKLLAKFNANTRSLEICKLMRGPTWNSYFALVDWEYLCATIIVTASCHASRVNKPPIKCDGFTAQLSLPLDIPVTQYPSVPKKSKLNMDTTLGMYTHGVGLLSFFRLWGREAVVDTSWQWIMIQGDLESEPIAKAQSFATCPHTAPTVFSSICKNGPTFSYDSYWRVQGSQIPQCSATCLCVISWGVNKWTWHVMQSAILILPQGNRMVCCKRHLWQHFPHLNTAACSKLIPRQHAPTWNR